MKQFTVGKNLWWILALIGICIGLLLDPLIGRGFFVGGAAGWYIAHVIGFAATREDVGWLGAAILLPYVFICIPVDDERWKVKWYYKFTFLALLIIGAVVIDNII